MKKLAVAFAFVAIACAGYSQSAAVQAINEVVNPSAALDPLKYLASDELKGRSAKRPEIHVAAKYISDQLKKAGANPLPANPDYYQNFELKLLSLANSGSLTAGNNVFTIGKDLLQVDGQDISTNAPIVFAGKAVRSRARMICELNDISILYLSTMVTTVILSLMSAQG